MPDIDLAVLASNQLTGDWLTDVSIQGDTLVSGFSAWSLLSVLAAGATGDTRDELEAVTATRDASLPNALWSVVDQDAPVAQGLWVKDSIEVEPGFRASLPTMTIGQLPLDEGALDRWATEATDGIITRLPPVATNDTLMLLATALAIDVAWGQPFTPGMLRWEGETRLNGLWRSEPIADTAGIAHGECSISRYVCASTSPIDVHIVAGAHNDDPAAVLRTALSCLDGTADLHPASRLRRGDAAGCLRVEKVRGHRDEIRVGLPKFSLRDEHELTDRPALFGLATATDTGSGHFGLISREPLAVERALQVAVADFSETGFRAAASTLAAVMAGAGLPDNTCHVVSLTHDRPFGFLAVHRPTNLVLFAGWIATPNACEPWGSGFESAFVDI